MKPWTLFRLLVTLLICYWSWYGVAKLCMFMGSSARFQYPAINDIAQTRWNEIVVASIVGAALAAAGTIYQALLRNPLAEPYLLGVSSGASLASYLWTLPAISGAVTLGADVYLGQQSAAFFGAILSMFIVFTLAGVRGRIEPVSLLLVGVIINALNAAIFLLLISVNKETSTPGGPISFIIGTINSGSPQHQIKLAGYLAAAGFVWMLAVSGQLNAAMLSDSEAESLGVRVNRLRWMGLIIASLVTAAAIAISGPIGFVGLICPHVARMIVGNDQRRLLPVATMLGAVLLALADRLSRAMVAWGWLETVVPVGVLTALLGGPFFLAVLWNTRRKEAA